MPRKYRKDTVLRILDEGSVHEVLKLVRNGNLEVLNRRELIEISKELDFNAYHNEELSHAPESYFSPLSERYKP